MTYQRGLLPCGRLLPRRRERCHGTTRALGLPGSCSQPSRVGSCVLYDPRVMHRGGANESEGERALVYLTLSRVWYRDTLNP